MKFWRDHSLTLTMGVLGALMLGIAFTFESSETRLFDLWLSLGSGVLTVALFYFLSQFFREKAKPED